MSESSLKAMRMEHLKSKADHALKAGNYRTAWETYTEAINIGVRSALTMKLYSNRSFAFSKAKRFQDALSDADVCCSSFPKWDKAHFRRATALIGLNRKTEALFEFSSALKLSNGDSSCRQAVKSCCAMLTMEELGSCISQLICEMEEKSRIKRAQLEVAEAVVMGEAWFQFLKAQTKADSRRPWPYETHLIDWLEHGLPEYLAYWLRGKVNCIAKCYLQARQDAVLGIGALQQLMSKKEHEGYLKVLKCELGDMYHLLGCAYRAERDHEDKDDFHALSSMYRARDLNPSKKEVWDDIKSVEENLSLEEMSAAAMLTVRQAEAQFGGIMNPEMLPVTNLQASGGGNDFVVECTIQTSSAKLSDFSADIRGSLRDAIAACAGGGLSTKNVVLENVEMQRPSGFKVRCVLSFGPDQKGALTFIEKVNKTSARFIEEIKTFSKQLGSVFDSQMGNIIASACRFKSNSAENSVDDTLSSSVNEDHGESTLVLPAKPKMELQVPYKSYSLVYADGSPVPRKTKHAFALTIVRYDAKQGEKEIWTQISDGSCRWRQSSSEIKIIALKVPTWMKPSEFDVTISPYYIKVASNQSSEVFLEGTLERGIIPDESVWVAGQGMGEDGFMLFLQKMNLELLQKYWMHNEMWWPRLFIDHTETEWDDCEKDYSDLPPTVMEQYRAKEAHQQIESRNEKEIKDELDSLDDLDSARIRWREERLHIMRVGTTTPWVKPGAVLSS